MKSNILKSTAVVVGTLGAAAGIGYNAHQNMFERRDREAAVSRLESELVAERERVAALLAGLNRDVSPERLMAAIERVRCSLVAIGPPGREASGFFINDNEYIVTNEHVSSALRHYGMAKDGYPVTLNLRGREEEPFTFYAPLLQVNGKNGLEDAESPHIGGSDVAILHVPPDVRRRLPSWVRSVELRDVSQDPLRDGERVIVVGNPFILKNTVTEGIISNSERHLPVGPNALYPVVQVSGEMGPGSSGGIVADLEGRLIAIAFYGFGPGMQHGRHVLNLKAELARYSLAELSPGEQAMHDRWSREWETIQVLEHALKGTKQEEKKVPEPPAEAPEQKDPIEEAAPVLPE